MYRLGWAIVGALTFWALLGVLVATGYMDTLDAFLTSRGY